MVRAETLRGGKFVYVDDNCPFGIDAVLLADFAAEHPARRACDLGTGSGIIPLLWHTGENAPAVDAVEIYPATAALARRSIADNGLSPTVTVHEADWCALSLPTGTYDTVVCNPPYFAAHSGKVCTDPARRLARHETATTLCDVVTAARRLLKSGGHFCLCHRPERLPDVLITLREHGLEPKRLQWVHTRCDTAPFLFLCDAVKGGKPALSVLPPHILEK